MSQWYRRVIIRMACEVHATINTALSNYHDMVSYLNVSQHLVACQQIHNYIKMYTECMLPNCVDVNSHPPKNDNLLKTYCKEHS